MWPWNKREKKKLNKNENKDDYPIIETSLTEVKRAVREFADQAPKGITTRVLVLDDHSIDFHLLAPYLNGIPNKPFYMSKETYEIFDESEKEMAIYLDKIQHAVDSYINMYNSPPTISGDPHFKVSYIKLENSGLLNERPNIDFYITDQEYLVSHKRPN